MSRENGTRTAWGGALSATMLVTLLVAPAAAEPPFATDDRTFELIVSETVPAGTAPKFEVVQTDLAGLADILDGRSPGERIEWNSAAQLTWRPTDSAYSLDRATQHIGLETAWDTTRGSSDIVIAVLDSGVNASAEFGRRLLAGASMINGDPHVDVFGHGSAVALIAAAAHNGVGVAGVCPGCSILPVQVATTEGRVPWAAAAEGIIWAVDDGADVLNVSFGARSTPSIIDDAIGYAIANDVVVVAAAGNNGDALPFYPAAVDGVISVAANDPQLNRYSWSSFGSWVDLSAPGCASGIHGADRAGCGTSFAAPWVSGIAGLLAAERGSLTPAEAETALEATTSSLSWVETGWLDAARLFPSPLPAPTPRQVPGAASAFRDVDPDAYYAEPVDWLVANRITTGTSPTTYDPDAPVTRAQLATFLWRLSADS